MVSQFVKRERAIKWGHKFVFPQVLERTGRLPGQKEQGFTTVGKAKMASKQYNSPMAMYSEDIIEEIMTQVLLGHKLWTVY